MSDRFAGVRKARRRERRERVAARFWAKVDARCESECWEWQATRRDTGYGQLWFRGTVVAAHRVAYTLAIGEIPAGLFILHSCDNPPCVNPNHLRAGTAAENSADWKARGGKIDTRAKLDDGAKREIRALFKSGASKRSIARRFGVSDGAIRRATRDLPIADEADSDESQLTADDLGKILGRGRQSIRRVALDLSISDEGESQMTADNLGCALCVGQDSPADCWNCGAGEATA